MAQIVFTIRAEVGDGEMRVDELLVKGFPAELAQGIGELCNLYPNIGATVQTSLIYAMSLREDCEQFLEDIRLGVIALKSARQ